MRPPPGRPRHEPGAPEICRRCAAREAGLCGALDPDQLRFLLARSRRRIAPSGSTWIEGEGASGKASTLTDGVLKLARSTADGRQQLVGLRFPPDLIGRPLDPGSQVVSIAATDAHLCETPIAVFDDLLRASPDAQDALRRQAARELEEARALILLLGRKTAPERVASFLVSIARRLDPAGGASAAFELPFSRADIADLLGLTVETVSRRLTALREAEAISIDRARTVRIPDLEALAAHTGEV